MNPTQLTNKFGSSERAWILTTSLSSDVIKDKSHHHLFLSVLLQWLFNWSPGVHLLFYKLIVTHQEENSLNFNCEFNCKLIVKL